MPEQRRVELGRVVGAHGLSGELRIRYFGQAPEHLGRVESILRAEARGDASARDYRVINRAGGRQGEMRLALEGVPDRTVAETLRGLLVLVDSGQLKALDEGEYYWHQLIGCGVVTEGGEELGEVAELWDTGAHDLLVVRGGERGQLLLPTRREFMIEVDLSARKIVIDAIPGLLENGS